MKAPSDSVLHGSRQRSRQPGVDNPVCFRGSSSFPAAASLRRGLFAEVAFDPLDQAFSYGVLDNLRPALPSASVFWSVAATAMHGFVVQITDQARARSSRSNACWMMKPRSRPVSFDRAGWPTTICGRGQVHAVVPPACAEQAGTRPEIFVTAAGRRNPQPSNHRAKAGLGSSQGRPTSLPGLGAAGCGLQPIDALSPRGYQRHLRASISRRESASFALRPCRANVTRSPLDADRTGARQGLSRIPSARVTGSGKTELYLRAIEEVVRQGKEALVLVPEISLTPQTIQRFRGRFGEVAVLHSHLTNAERAGYWRRVAGGQVQVVVGARSAVFAPTRQLGLIVIDEEHENSFKQESTPRYHGRDVAVMRAHLENIPIILGSATPSLESWHNAQRKHYTLLRLPNRVLDCLCRRCT